MLCQVLDLIASEMLQYGGIIQVVGFGGYYCDFPLVISHSLSLNTSAKFTKLRATAAFAEREGVRSTKVRPRKMSLSREILSRLERGRPQRTLSFYPPPPRGSTAPTDRVSLSHLWTRVVKVF